MYLFIIMLNVIMLSVVASKVLHLLERYDRDSTEITQIMNAQPYSAYLYLSPSVQQSTSRSICLPVH